MFNLYVLGFTHWAVKFDKNKGDWGAEGGTESCL